MSKKYAVSQQELQRRLNQQKKELLTKNPSKVIEPQYLQGIEVKLKKRWIVENWRSGWLWLSNWFVALIAYVQFYGVPTELIQLLPMATQQRVTATLAVLAFIGRFIDQNRAKPLPPASDTFKEDV
ncbi:hypothetical protein [Acinetobacter baumannii]|uniref:DUF7940 domain-containing protein n=1 Tax=Acinetobacter baumannii TaxID=470 RepID=UPI0001F8AE19|nr:hypothetical protein [Acinetobacter baumannii]ADX03008.1 Hypothetical protein ABK1_1374 [Acinetobacter baumannii 1656-2]AOP63350.1 hypothetical protein DU202_02187 [Acinetobacter baumannii DU202]RQL52001.1 hypothetical protein BJI61_00180 [Acinetobacter baumannii]RSP41886.1 hypothetical protein EA733_06325 [Acinetobacter baumannii]